MASRLDLDLRPSDSFRRAMRARFAAQADRLYRPRAGALPRLAGFAAAAALALSFWWGFGAGPDASRTEGPAVARLDAPARAAPPPVPRSVAVAPAVTRTPAHVPQQSGPRALPPRLAVEDTPDGTRLAAAPDSDWRWSGARRLELRSGRVYLDVEPTGEPFVVEHAEARVHVTGTRLVASAEGGTLDVDLGSGRAELENAAGHVLLAPGETGIARPGLPPERRDGRRFSSLAAFAAEAFDEAGEDAGAANERFTAASARFPASNTPAAPIVIERYHLDVHIEDGLARTTIDQTFYNPNGSRVEGTFLFPLPPDASISRLAMYVNGKLMEGGMAERGRAVEVYEGIVKKMQDPALLEWVEGSTFRLRIFPFEPSSERRIILSFQQPLESLYETDRYRFPLRPPSERWSEFSMRVLVKGGARAGWKVETPTYDFTRVGAYGDDLELAYDAANALPEKDVLVEVHRAERPELDHASQETDGGRFVSVTLSPEVTGEVYRGSRRVLLIADRTGKSSTAERRAQRRLEEEILRALDRTDRVNVLAYNTDARLWSDGGFERRSLQNLLATSEFLAREEFVGAGDLARALERAAAAFGEPEDGDVIVYAGDGVDTLSGREPERLALLVPAGVTFLAMPVHLSYNRPLLDTLATRSGGRVLAVSPDDRLGWRAFDLIASLRTPSWRDLSWRLLDAGGEPIAATLAADRATLRAGETVRLAARLDGDWPAVVEVAGRRYALPERRSGQGWIPRLWAKLHIEELERDSAAEHRDEIVRLGKEYYVMTPFTALLVLENDAMYEEFGIDRGRKDHWAIYPTPETWEGRRRAPQFVRDVFFGEDAAQAWRWGTVTNPATVWFDVDGRLSGNVSEFLPLFTWNVNSMPPSDPTMYFLKPGAQPVADAWVVNHFYRNEFDPVLLPVLDLGFVCSPWALSLGGNGGRGVDRWANSPNAWTRLHTFTTTYDVLDGVGLPRNYRFSVADARQGIPVTERARQDSVAPVWNESGPQRARTPTSGAPPAVDTRAAAGPSATAGTEPSPRLRRFPSLDETSTRLAALLPHGVDLVARDRDLEAIVLAGGARSLRDGERVTGYFAAGTVTNDPLFPSVPLRFASGSLAAERVWFLLSPELLAAGSGASERHEETGAGESRLVVRVEQGGVLARELVFAGRRPLELRHLAGEAIVRRVVYDAWQEHGGHDVPAGGQIVGPRGDVVEAFELAYARPTAADRASLDALEKQIGTAFSEATSHLHVALSFYLAADRSGLEAFLAAAEAQGQLDEHLRRVAHLAARRWGSDHAAKAGALDVDSRALDAWLPGGGLPEAEALRRALDAGDLATVTALLAGAHDAAALLAALEESRPGLPADLQAFLDLGAAAVAERHGWNLRAYELLERTRRSPRYAADAALAERLGGLALALDDVPAALAHGERALALDPAGAGRRLAWLVEVAERRTELWAEHGRELLERWCEAAPRDPEPFRRLADLHDQAGRLLLAVRYASQEAELSDSAEAYTALAERFEKYGDAERAAACRRLAATR